MIGWLNRCAHVFELVSEILHDGDVRCDGFPFCHVMVFVSHPYDVYLARVPRFELLD